MNSGRISSKPKINVKQSATTLVANFVRLCWKSNFGRKEIKFGPFRGVSDPCFEALVVLALGSKPAYSSPHLLHCLCHSSSSNWHADRVPDKNLWLHDYNRLSKELFFQAILTLTSMYLLLLNTNKFSNAMATEISNSLLLSIWPMIKYSTSQNWLLA